MPGFSIGFDSRANDRQIFDDRQERPVSDPWSTRTTRRNQNCVRAPRKPEDAMIPDFREYLVQLNQQISSIDENNPADALSVLQGAYESTQRMFKLFMVGIESARKENKTMIKVMVGLSAAAGGAMGLVVGSGIIQAATVVSSSTMCQNIAGFFGFGGGGVRTGGISRPVSAAVLAVTSILGCAALGGIVSAIGHVESKRLDNEVNRKATLRAFDLRDTVLKIKRSAQRIPLDMAKEDGGEVRSKLIADLETLEKAIMAGVPDL